jgi:hypothetical protein
MLRQHTPAYFSNEPMVQNLQFANSGVANFYRPTASESEGLLPLGALPQAARAFTQSGLMPQPWVGSGALAPLRSTRKNVACRE